MVCAFPNGADYGLVYASTLPTVTLTTTLTGAGQATFGYLRPDASLVIGDTWHYLSDPAPGADTTPLLDDGSGRTILAIFRPAMDESTWS